MGNASPEAKDLIDAFSRAYAMVVEESASREAADLMLETFVSAVRGDYGFFGFRRLDDDGSPFLHTMAMSNIAWNEATAAAYALHLSEGMKFTNLDTLFGQVLVQQNLLIARDARLHPSAGGVPAGHPSLDRFLGIPLCQRGRMEGMIGIANFDAALPDALLEAFADQASALMYPLFDAMKTDTVAQSRRDINVRSRFDMLERIIGGFAHNLNNELVVISEVRTTLANSCIDVERELAADVEDSVTAITDLVSDLKTFARVSGSDDLVGTLRSAARLISLIGLADCELNLLCMPTGPEVAVSPEFLMSWLVEGAVLVTQTLRGVTPLRLDCHKTRRFPDTDEECLELIMAAGVDAAPAPGQLSALADEVSDWGVELEWRANQGLCFRIPLGIRLRGEV